MKANTGFSETPQKDRSGEKKTDIARWILTVMMAIVIVWAMSVYSQYKKLQGNPLQQYMVERTCNFISMGDFETAVCTDGTAWTVSPFQK